MVLQNICGRYSFLSWKYTCVYYNGTNCLGGWGFCDLYNTSTGEVWELKKYSNSRSCTTAAATIQLNRYVNGKLKHNLDLPLTKPYITEITSGNFVFTSGGYRYTVTYWNEGNGILRYSYDVQKTQVRIAAEMVVTVVSLSIALTVAPEIAPIILLA